MVILKIVIKDLKLLSICIFSYIYLLSTSAIVALLFHFLGAEVQVAIADPLDLKPVLEVTVSAALKLHLQAIYILFLEAAAGGVCVLVEAKAVPQAGLQRRLQAALHCIAHDDSQQHEDSEERGDGKVRLQEVLPPGKSPCIQSILTDL